MEKQPFETQCWGAARGNQRVTSLLSRALCVWGDPRKQAFPLLPFHFQLGLTFAVTDLGFLKGESSMLTGGEVELTPAL